MTFWRVRLVALNSTTFSRQNGWPDPRRHNAAVTQNKDQDSLTASGFAEVAIAVATYDVPAALGLAGTYITQKEMTKRATAKSGKPTKKPKPRLDRPCCARRARVDVGQARFHARIR